MSSGIGNKMNQRDCPRCKFDTMFEYEDCWHCIGCQKEIKK